MNEISISNFRKIKDAWSLRLEPVTFLTGKNNSGKSSVLKALMLINDYGHSNNHLQLDLSGPSFYKHKIDSSDHAINRDNFQKGNQELSFKFENKGAHVKLKFVPIGNYAPNQFYLKYLSVKRFEDQATFVLVSDNQQDYSLQVDEMFFQEKSDGQNEMLDIHIGLVDDEILNIQNELDATTSPSRQISLKQELERSKKNKRTLQKDLKNAQKKHSISEKDRLYFRPKFSTIDMPNEDWTIGNMIRKHLSQYFIDNSKKVGISNQTQQSLRVNYLADYISDALKISVIHLSAQRNNQTRLILHENEKTDMADLVQYHTDDLVKDSDANSFILHWLKEFGIGEGFKVRSVESVASVVEILEEGYWVNLVDKGFGAGQLFSILLSIGEAIDQRTEDEKENNFHMGLVVMHKLLIIEEPEANLHPALQSKLADMFSSASFDYGLQFIIETHSEYLIRRSQLIELKRSENILRPPYIFSLYYFDGDGPYQMEYTEEGNFSRDFGPGFYDESAKMNMKRIKAARKLKK